MRGRAVAATLLLCLGAGCAVAPRPQLEVTGPRYEPGWYQLPRAGSVYRIDPEESALEVVVRRSGWLPFLGHHHILQNRELEGYLWVGPDRSAARADVKMEVGAFVVDPPELRQPGDGLGPQPDPEAIAATRANLLGPRVLDAEGHPEITGQARLLTWSGPASARVALALNVRGYLWEHEAEAEITERDGRVRVVMAFDVEQSALGMEPIGVFAGAISVADRLRVRVELQALPVSDTAAPATGGRRRVGTPAL